MQWEIEVRGDVGDLRVLGQVFSGPDIVLVEREGRFYLTAEVLNRMRDGRAVMEQAREILAVLSSSCRLQFGMRSSFEVGGVTEVRGDGLHTYHLFPESTVAHVRMGMPTLTVTRSDGSVESSGPAGTVPTWFAASVKSAAVAKALRLRDKESLNWVELYRILEVVEGDVGPKMITDAGWASASDLRRFKHTANSVEAAGDDARHGKEQEQPPAEQMPLPEARDLVDRVLLEWLERASLTTNDGSAA